MRLPSVMSHKFSEVPQADIPRSSFDRSHGCKTTFDAGFLIPIFVDEALPGDTFSLDMQGFARMATPIHPIMDNVFLDTFFFAVPNRLVWDNWEKFCGAQDNPADSTDFVVPTITTPGGYATGTLYDYFGLPIDTPMTHSALPMRAYNLIWNEWFRDQNLQDSISAPTDNGPDIPNIYVPQRRGKRHDYFTSALPWPQKGDSVDLPLGTSAPVTIPGGIGVNPAVFSTATGAWQMMDAAAGSNIVDINSGTTVDTNEQLIADLTDASAATINQLRQAFQIQKLYERDARGGTRYTEIVLAHFGVSSPDARLQRPEYLGGGTSMVNISPVPQTSSTDVTSPQGNLAAIGTASLNRHGFTKSFTEHSIVIGLICARADISYQQGVNRMWDRSTRWDFYWPALAHIGEQAILNREIYLQNTSADNDVFGYQERFAEYRYKPSMITGEFRSGAPTPLDTWHLAEDFSALPTLNSDFIEVDPPIDRVIAVPSAPHFLFDSYIRYRCARPMPIYGVPGLMDHF